MIYTCTTNPSLDYYMSFDKIEAGISNRSDIEFYEAGGKGVNVSIVLNNFRIPSICLGFLGGFVKDYYLSFISNYPNIQPLFTTIKENSRINVKVMDNQNETGLNAKGPSITKEEFNKFKSRFMNIYVDDIFVLSGNIQDQIEEEMYELIKQLIQEGIKVVLDTDRSFIDRCIDLKPFMIKINDYYLLDANDEVDLICKDMIDRGTTYVMYSHAHKKSYLYTKDIRLMCENQDKSLVNTTGSSDSMVAGFLYGIIRGANPTESFKYAIASSLATTITNDLQSKEKIEELFNTIEVKEF